MVDSRTNRGVSYDRRMDLVGWLVMGAFVVGCVVAARWVSTFDSHDRSNGPGRSRAVQEFKRDIERDRPGGPVL